MVQGGVTAIITVSPVRGTIALFPENVIVLHHITNNTSPFFKVQFREENDPSILVKSGCIIYCFNTNYLPQCNA